MLPLGVLYHLSERVVDRKLHHEQRQDHKMSGPEYRLYKELNSSYQKTFLYTLTPKERRNALISVDNGMSPERAIDKQLDQRM